MMLPMFEYYVAQIPLAELRTHTWYGHNGAFFPETSTMWGSYTPANYGCNRSLYPCRPRPGTPSFPARLPDSMVCVPNLRHYYTQGLELSALMLEYYWHTHDDQFATRILLPTIAAVLTFFLEHYGPEMYEAQLVLTPSQALETWQNCVNPAQDIAGLIWVTQRALRIPRAVFAAAAKGAAALQALETAVVLMPSFTFANDKDGAEYLKPGAYCDHAGNVENPELYASHPFPLLAANRSEPWGFNETDTRYFELYLENSNHSVRAERF